MNINLNLPLVIIFVIIIIILVVVIANPLMVYRGTLRPTQNQLTAHDAKALVLTCIDFRLVDDYVFFLDSIGLNNNYDEFVLAGGSLGFNQTEFPTWISAFRDHVDLAVKLHHIEKVIVIDHAECGAYKMFYDNPTMTPFEEYELHVGNLRLFKNTMAQIYPKLYIETYLMDLYGRTELIN